MEEWKCPGTSGWSHILSLESEVCPTSEAGVIHTRRCLTLSPGESRSFLLPRELGSTDADRVT